jgi:hypothetical protein
MTNSTALATARCLRARVQALQSKLDDLAHSRLPIKLHAIRITASLALTDAEELEQFLSELAEQTLNARRP